ncbi:glutamate dehydrogenase, partial [Pontibacter sp. HJ8]
LKYGETNALGCVTGKPVGQGGIRGRAEATGLGVYYGIREALGDTELMKRTGITGNTMQGKRIIVQGLGNVGYNAAHFCQQDGAIIIGIAEREGGIYNADGIDVAEAFKHRSESGSILNFGNARNFENSMELLEEECDILIPAALENQINEENAGRIRAKIVAEGANGPVTRDAEKILLSNGVIIIPDLYLNAGGVTVSYFEWLKNLSNVRFGRMGKRAEEASHRRLVNAIESSSGKSLNATERNLLIQGADEISLVRSGLEDTMINAYHEIRGVMNKKGITDMRTAAFLSAIEKIGVSYEALGIFP